jgi:hypothetical protein
MKICKTLELDNTMDDIDMPDVMMDDEPYVEREEIFMMHLT